MTKDKQKSSGNVLPEDRELFIFLLGFDAVADVANFHRIRNGEFDDWEKMQKIVDYRLAIIDGAEA